jgi:hypothetical protein
MEYVYLALFIILLVLLLAGSSKLDARTRKKNKQAAYKLLETSGPDAKEIKHVILNLRLYGGRWRKDKECIQLIQRLQDKL